VRFAFTDDQLLFRDALREFLAKEYSPDTLRAAWASGVSHSNDLWRGLADLGVVGSTASEADGGLGLREIDLVLLLEESGRAALAEPLLATTAVAIPLLVESAEERARSWLEAIVRGESVVAIAVDDGLVLDADTASLLVQFAPGEVVVSSREAFDIAPQPSVDGARHLFRVRATGRGHVIATGDEAERLRSHALDRAALGAAAELIGLADRMLSMTVDYVQQREQFGVPIGSFQAIKHHLADALLAVEFARPVVYSAAYSMTHGLPTAAREVSMAKATASDAATLVAAKALQCHGAIAYTVEYDLHMWMKRAWALASAWGDARYHRARVAESVLGSGAAD
jgi:alkylation response protein AidB-like acyl-CoA dehydrogenase